MTINKTIVCLANSRKLSGRCIAGREIDGGSPGAWVRPVSARERQEVSERERQYQDGRDPKLLDVIEISLVEHQPRDHQQENWLLDPNIYWSRVDKISWENLEPFSDLSESLWLNGFHTYNGMNDRIPVQQAEQERSSLKLIYADEVRLCVFAPGEVFGNPKRFVQAKFNFNNNNYALRVTDPYIERDYLARDDGYYKLSECYITISLTEPYEGYCYKLVAAIIMGP